MARRFLFILFLFCLPGCREKTAEIAFSTQPQLTRDLDVIKKRGYLVALLDNNSVSYFIYKGRPMGYEYELLHRLTTQLHVELKIKVISGIEEAIDKLNRGEG